MLLGCLSVSASELVGTSHSHLGRHVHTARLDYRSTSTSLGSSLGSSLARAEPVMGRAVLAGQGSFPCARSTYRSSQGAACQCDAALREPFGQESHLRSQGRNPKAQRVQQEAHGKVRRVYRVQGGVCASNGSPAVPVTQQGEDRQAGGDESVLLDPGPGLYTPFVEYCVEELHKRMELRPFPMQDRFRQLAGLDAPRQRAVSRSTAFQSEKVRQMRSADISAGPKLQVLNLVIFPRPEYDLPYFCADLVTFPRGHLVVLDLNPLYSTEEYMDKHILPALPICHKYSQALPWGGQFTSESLQFFSPALLWSRLPLEETVHGALFEAYKEYLQVWLDMLDAAEPETDEKKIAANREAQHRYVCWRLQKDPGRPVLTRLFGEELCEEYIEEFLFDGLKTLGCKTFLDYFPEYRAADGSVMKQRSVAGKSFSTRPWDEHGRLIAS